MASNQLLWKLLAAVWGALHCWSNAFSGLVRSSAQFPTAAAKTHYEFTEEVMLAKSFSAAKFFSFSITLHICKLYKSACVWNTRGLYGIIRFCWESAPPPSSTLRAHIYTHARRAWWETNLTWNWNALDYFAFIKLKAIKWFQYTHEDKSVCTDYSNREYIITYLFQLYGDVTLSVHRVRLNSL